MAEFLRFTKVKKTRKLHMCFACLEKIDIDNAVYQWISIDGGEINSAYLHEECGEIVQNICFSCQWCGEDDGYQNGFLREAMLNNADCEAVRNFKKDRKGEDE